MQTTDIGNPAERKKLIWAVVLGFIAIIFLWWTLFGFGGSSKPTQRAATQNSSPVVQPPVVSTQQAAPEIKDDLLNQLRPIIYQSPAVSVPEAKRNIFTYYDPPKPAAAASATPTPTPTPPVLLAAVSPSNVYAQTGDFTLEVTGDKFTPEMRVVVDGRELPTRYVSPQQISATVAASVIASPGGRKVMLRTADGKLYSNEAVLNVTPPPTPNYTYVGIIGTPRHLDTAILQDKGSRDILNVQRGDVLGGRFRVTSISEKELVLIDTNLKVKHTLPFSHEGDKGFNPLQRQPPQVPSDDEP